jgi:hypothetical protein
VTRDCRTEYLSTVRPLNLSSHPETFTLPFGKHQRTVVAGTFIRLSPLSFCPRSYLPLAIFSRHRHHVPAIPSMFTLPYNGLRSFRHSTSHDFGRAALLPRAPATYDSLATPTQRTTRTITIPALTRPLPDDDGDDDALFLSGPRQ